MASKYRPKVGDLVQVEWLDTSAFTNARMSSVKLSRGVNMGIVCKVSKTEIMLQTGNYPDDPLDERLGDFTIIPRAWTDKVKLIKRKVAI